jgi:hypothetical protein
MAMELFRLQRRATQVERFSRCSFRIFSSSHFSHRFLSFFPLSSSNFHHPQIQNEFDKEKELVIEFQRIFGPILGAEIDRIKVVEYFSVSEQQKKKQMKDN